MTERMKIYWPIGLTREMPGRTNRSDLFDRTLNDYARTVMGPDVEVTIAWMKRTTGMMSSAYLGMINDTQIVSDILDAERDGYAAATVGGHWDPALAAAREAASIPVVGPGEAAMLLAGTLGRKFAFLTVMEGYVPVIENNIRSYGLEPRAIARRPVRKFGMTYENIVRCLEGKDDEFLVELTKTARECIDDGADVIIAGGQLFGPIFQKHKFFTMPNTGVPVVEVSACGLKLARNARASSTQRDLRKSEHVNAPFRTPPREVVDDDAAQVQYRLSRTPSAEIDRAGHMIREESMGLRIRAVSLPVRSRSSLGMQAPRSAQDYPNRPIRFLVGFAAGGSSDVVARVIGQKMSEILGVGIPVENRTGANGTLAMRQAAQAAPDGYTMTIAGATVMAISPHTTANLGYDPVKDFIGVSTVSKSPIVIAANPSVKATNLKELAEVARSRHR